MEISDLAPHLAERTRWFRPRSDLSPSVIDSGKFVLYWTHHALRASENPALDVAIEVARSYDLPLLVYQGLSPHYRFASDRHHTFILEGARDLQQQYQELGIAYEFHLQCQRTERKRLLELASHSHVLVTEDFPLNPTVNWLNAIARRTTTPILTVDTACIVPSMLVGRAFDRAYSFRDATKQLYDARVGLPWPKIPAWTKELEPSIKAGIDLQHADLPELVSQCDIDHFVGPVGDTVGGSLAGYARWNAFVQKGLRHYANKRNAAELDATSRMSAYLHYGMVSPMRLAREASQARAEKYLDELLIWRELSYAFCHYRTDVDSVEATAEWAQQTLHAHSGDKREFIHSWETLSRGKSGQPLWDACQRSLLKHGELHNNVRMTWGKALLEWTESPDQALKMMLDLNHRYALDGRDPASYGGILWCIGQFDRPFFPEKPVIGTVRPRPLREHQSRMPLERYLQRVDGDLLDTKFQVAIVGAGLAGLMCARSLVDQGMDVTIFEKSRSLGGRLATKQPTQTVLPPESTLFQFDHGAQYFTVRSPQVQPYLESWIADGHVERWQGRVVELLENGGVVDKSGETRYVAKPRMRHLAEHLAKDLRIVFETEVASATSLPRADAWDGQHCTNLISTTGKNLGAFDAVIWNCPAQQLLAVWRSSTPTELQKPVGTVEMTPCWATMVTLERSLQVPWDGAFINSGPLAWIARDTSKPGRRKDRDGIDQDEKSKAGNTENWVLHSTAQWAQQHLEFPDERVTELLLEEFSRLIVGWTSLPRGIFQRSHRWRFAFPSLPLERDCLWDEKLRWGACGDWCKGPRVENAMLSGMAMAGRLLGFVHDFKTCH